VLGSSLSGHGALHMYLELCDINIISCSHHDSYSMYFYYYTNLLKNGLYNIIAYFDYTHIYISRKDLNRFLKLVNNTKPAVYLARDPISRLKTGLNHINFKVDKIDNCDLKTSVHNVLDRETYYFEAKNPTCEHIRTYWSYAESFLRMDFMINSLKPKCINYIDMECIRPSKILHTLQNLNSLYNIPRIPFEHELDNGLTYDELGVLLPITLNANLKDVLENGTDKNIQIIITTKQLKNVYKLKNYKNINNILIHNIFKNLIFCVHNNDLNYFLNNTKLKEYTQKYLNKFILELDQKMKDKKKHLIKEENILKFMKENREIRNIWKNTFNAQLNHIKTNRPDIVASWKYYQEFEKICDTN
ncbi:DUF2972 domain-containing protein, partial [Campylobacter insulaenigrae]|uniref:DUF2972 domain-containing protein n=1 Tax=Campylobacter insulaenigrae TaxID=260714 RepID=UPI0021529522